jgi:hypothetical protein
VAAHSAMGAQRDGGDSLAADRRQQRRCDHLCKGR